jgi:hypothetical protein
MDLVAIQRPMEWAHGQVNLYFIAIKIFQEK